MAEHDADAQHDDRATGQDAGGPRRTPVTQQVGRIAIVIVAALFIAFALANAQAVDFSWIFGETNVVEEGGERVSGGVPLIVLLLVAFGAGALIATLVSWQRHRRDR
ncbi:MAG: LapA family protein [Nitriliruptor sp.]